LESKPVSTRYHSYLLRLWSADEGQAWRVMLEAVGTHERHSFANLESLFEFLRRQIGEIPQTLEDITHGTDKSVKMKDVPFK